MKIVAERAIRCSECANARGYSSGPTEYEKKVVEWAFTLNGMVGACHDSQEFKKCGIGKKLREGGECAWFAKRAAKL